MKNKKRFLKIQNLEPRILWNAVPAANLQLSETAPAGETIEFEVAVENLQDSAQAGANPFVDIHLDADVSFDSATLEGNIVDAVSTVFNNLGQAIHPITGEIIDGTVGDTLVALNLTNLNESFAPGELEKIAIQATLDPGLVAQDTIDISAAFGFDDNIPNDGNIEARSALVTASIVVDDISLFSKLSDHAFEIGDTGISTIHAIIQENVGDFNNLQIRQVLPDGIAVDVNTLSISFDNGINATVQNAQIIQINGQNVLSVDINDVQKDPAQNTNLADISITYEFNVIGNIGDVNTFTTTLDADQILLLESQTEFTTVSTNLEIQKELLLLEQGLELDATDLINNPVDAGDLLRIRNTIQHIDTQSNTVATIESFSDVLPNNTSIASDITISDTNGNTLSVISSANAEVVTFNNNVFTLDFTDLGENIKELGVLQSLIIEYDVRIENTAQVGQVLASTAVIAHDGRISQPTTTETEVSNRFSVTTNLTDENGLPLGIIETGDAIKVRIDIDSTEATFNDLTVSQIIPLGLLPDTNRDGIVNEVDFIVNGIVDSNGNDVAPTVSFDENTRELRLVFPDGSVVSGEEGFSADAEIEILYDLVAQNLGELVDNDGVNDNILNVGLTTNASFTDAQGEQVDAEEDFDLILLGIALLELDQVILDPDGNILIDNARGEEVRIDAGDTIVVQNTIAHTVNSVATLLLQDFSDTLPENTQFSDANAAVTVTIPDALLGGTVDIVLTENQVDPQGDGTIEIDLLALLLANNINVLGLGQEVIITYELSVQSSIQAGDDITTNAKITHDLINEATDVNSAQVEGELTVNTTITDNNGNPIAAAQVGDTLNISTAIVATEGSHDGLSITYALPVGLVPDGNFIVTGVEDINGNPVDPVVTIDEVNGTVTLEFPDGTIVSPEEGFGAGPGITVSYSTQLDNVDNLQDSDNQLSFDITTNAQFTNADGNIVNADPDIDTITITLAALQIDEQLLDSNGNVISNNGAQNIDVDAGDSLTVRSTIEHDALSRGAANVQIFNNVLPENTQFADANAAVIVTLPDGNTVTLTAAAVEDGNGNISVDLGQLLEDNGFAQLELGQTVVVDYNIEVLESIEANDTIATNAAVTHDNRAPVEDNNEITITARLDAAVDLADENNNALATVNVGDRINISAALDMTEGTVDGLTLTQVLPNGLVPDTNNDGVVDSNDINVAGITDVNGNPANFTANFDADNGILQLVFDDGSVIAGEEGFSANGEITLDFAAVLQNSDGLNDPNFTITTDVSLIDGNGDTVNAVQQQNQITLSIAVLEVEQVILDVNGNVVIDNADGNDVQVDAGDTIAIQNTIRHAVNSFGSSLVQVFSDTLPQNTAFVDANAAVNVTIPDSNGGNIDIVLSANDVDADGDGTLQIDLQQLLVDNNVDVLDQGEEIVVTYNVAVQSSVQAGDDLATDASVTHDNTREATDSSLAQVQGELIVDTTITDENGNAPGTVEIGDTLNIQTIIDATEGSYDDLTITQQLPVGVIPDGNFIVEGAEDINGNPVNPVVTVDDVNGTVTFEFAAGTVVAPAQGFSAGTGISISFAAEVDNVDNLVDNDGVNDNELNFDITSDATFTDADGNVVNADQNVATITIGLPALQVDEQILDSNGNVAQNIDVDAGDSLTVRSTIEHDALSRGAANVQIFNNVLPENTQFADANAAVIVTLPDGNTVTLTAAAVEDGNGNISVDLGQLLEDNGFAQLELGQTVIVDYNIEVLDSVQPNDSLTTNSNVTHDNRAVQDGNTVVIDNGIALQASVEGGTFVIGESIPVTLEIDFVEGTHNNVVLTQPIPQGVVIEDIANGVTIRDQNGNDVVPDNISLNGNNDLEIVFNELIVAGQDQFNVNAVDLTIEYNLVLENDRAQNANNDVVTIVGATFNTDALVEPILTNDVQFTIVEPVVDFTQQLLGVDQDGNIIDLAGIDAQDVIRIRNIIEHNVASTADAFNLTFADVLPISADFTFVENSISIVVVNNGVQTNVAVGNNFTFDNATGDLTIDLAALGLDSLELGNELVIEYDVVIGDDVTALQDLGATSASVNFESIDGDSNSGIELIATLQNSSNFDVSQAKVAVTTSIIDNLDLVEGTTVQVQSNIDLIEALTENVVVTYTIPSGTQVDINSITATLSDGTPVAIQSITFDDSTNQVVIDFGDINAAGFQVFDGSKGDIVVDFDLTINDVVAISENTTLSTRVSASPNSFTTNSNESFSRTRVDIFIPAFDGYDRFEVTKRDSFDSEKVLILENTETGRNTVLTLSPIYSGVATPGSVQVIKIYNTAGNLVASKSLMVPSNGNWVVQFQEIVMSDTPHKIQIESDNSGTNSQQRNAVLTYAPATHGGVFQQEAVSLRDIFDTEQEIQWFSSFSIYFDLYEDDKQAQLDTESLPKLKK